MTNISQLIELFQMGDYRLLLEKAYQNPQQAIYQTQRYIQALQQYCVLFGETDVEIYSAPGRSEVGGNHTDHQQGMVLAASVNLDAIAVVGFCEDPVVRVVSSGYDMVEIPLNDLEKQEEEVGTTAGLIRGMIHGFVENGFPIGGFSAYVTSDVLIGAGLSSSAAFEVLIGTIMSGLFSNMTVSPVRIAQIAQYAENVYFEKPCGLMDQMASSVGGLVHIDFENPAQPLVNKLNIDFESFGYSLCIVDTKGSHQDLTYAYASIPAEMKAVAAFFDKPVLREVKEKQFYQNLPALREQVGDRAVLRAIHFFNEEKRVLKQVEALQKGRLKAFLESVKESGKSSFTYLQNVYTGENSSRQEMSLALAVSESILKKNGVCRVHGGGFAGTIQAFVLNSFVETYQAEMNALFGNGACHVLKVRETGGIKIF